MFFARLESAQFLPFRRSNCIHYTFKPISCRRISPLLLNMAATSSLLKSNVLRFSMCPHIDASNLSIALKANYNPILTLCLFKTLYIPFKIPARSSKKHSFFHRRQEVVTLTFRNNIADIETLVLRNECSDLVKVCSRNLSSQLLTLK